MRSPVPQRQGHRDKVMEMLGQLESLDQQQMQTAGMAQQMQINQQQATNRDMGVLADVGQSMVYGGQPQGAEILEFVARKYGFSPDQTRILAQQAAKYGMSVEEFIAAKQKLTANQPQQLPQ